MSQESQNIQQLRKEKDSSFKVLILLSFIMGMLSLMLGIGLLEAAYDRVLPAIAGLASLAFVAMNLMKKYRKLESDIYALIHKSVST
ncbi:MAG: hypothetical protein AAF696_02100 [Bacteroidota bacterium]